MEDLAELTAYLTTCQEDRKLEIKCVLAPVFSARMSDAALMEALVTGLPMAQGIQHRILRSRGRGVVLTAKLRYRDGVRMLDHWRSGGHALSAGETAALQTACTIAEESRCLLDAQARFDHVYCWVCQNIRYVHTAPGQQGYERLVGAASVLRAGQANCQGFADVLYLLCGLCGIECQYRCGRGVRKLHVWNAVFLDGEWRAVDASKGARASAD